MSGLKASLVGAALVVAMGLVATPAMAVEPPVNTGTITVGSSPWDVAITPDGRTAYVTVSGQNELAVIDVATSTVVQSIPVGADPQGLDVAENGLVYVANFVDGTVSAVDPASGATVATIPVGFHPQGIAASGDRVYVTNYGVQNAPDPESVSVIDTTVNAVVGDPIGVGANPAQIAVSPDSSIVYVTNRVDGTVSVIDAATLTVTATVPVGTQPWGIVLTPEGDTAYLALSGDNAIAVLDTATLSVTDLIDVSPGLQPWGIALSADRTLLYVSDSASESLGTVDLTSQTLLFDSDTDIDGWNIAADSGGCVVYLTNYAQDTVTVMDVSEPISIVDSPPTTARVGQPYDHRIAITPADAHASFQILSGQLPGGLQLDAATGSITGVPTASGTFSFDVGVTSCDDTADATVVVTVDPAPPTPTTPATPRPALAESGSASPLGPLLIAAGLLAAGWAMVGYAGRRSATASRTRRSGRG